MAARRRGGDRARAGAHGGPLPPPRRRAGSARAAVPGARRDTGRRAAAADRRRGLAGGCPRDVRPAARARRARVRRRANPQVRFPATATSRIPGRRSAVDLDRPVRGRPAPAAAAAARRTARHRHARRARPAEPAGHSGADAGRGDAARRAGLLAPARRQAGLARATAAAGRRVRVHRRPRCLRACLPARDVCAARRRRPAPPGAGVLGEKPAQAGRRQARPGLGGPHDRGGHRGGRGHPAGDLPAARRVPVGTARVGLAGRLVSSTSRRPWRASPPS